MAKRYCGEVTIELYWDDKKERYRSVVRCVKASTVIWVGRPAAAHGAVDAPRAYDAAARAALSFAMEEEGDRGEALADAAAPGITNGEYQVLRKPPDPCPECGKNRTSMRPEVRSFHPGAC